LFGPCINELDYTPNKHVLPLGLMGFPFCNTRHRLKPRRCIDRWCTSNMLPVR